MNENKFLKELDTYGYDYEIKRDKTRKISKIYIKPKCKGLPYCIAEFDIVEFMYSNGFLIENIVFNDPVYGMYVSFFNEESD